MKCQVCNLQPAKWIMYETIATDEGRMTRGNLHSVTMCEDCAMDAFENGSHEADGEVEETQS